MRLFAVLFSLSFWVFTAMAEEAKIPLDQVSVFSSPELAALKVPEGDPSTVIRQNLVGVLTQELDHGSSPTQFLEGKVWQTAVNLLPTEHPLILRFRISTDRFVQGSLKVEGLKRVSLYVNGHVVKGGSPFKLNLRNADHRIVILAESLDPDSKLSLSWEADGDQQLPSFRFDKGQLRLDSEVLYDSETIRQISLSPDGKLLFWVRRSYEPQSKDAPQTIAELIHPETQEVVYRWQAMVPRSVAWSSDNAVLAFTHSDAIFLLNRTNWQLIKLADQVKGASGLTWLDSQTLVFSWNQPTEKGSDITKRYRSLEDRWSYWRDRSQLFSVDRSTGLLEQLTENDLSSVLLDVDGENGRLLFYRNPVNYEEPAHSLTQLFELDLKKREERLIGEYRTFNSAAYHPDGLIISAGPSFYDGLGRTVDKAIPVNDYDAQIYLMTSQGKVSALSKQFNPSIRSIEVLKNGDLMLVASDQDRAPLFIYHFKSGKYELISADLDVVESFSVSKQQMPRFVYKGTSAVEPQKVLLRTTHSSESVVLFDSNEKAYRNRMAIEVKDWDYETSKSRHIDGRVYLPAGFDAQKTYPAIIYYYGGTSTVNRSFTGRWPFVLYASQGYVVYVLQPSGTTGYGQEFSAKHVNAWGLETADDIIESTQAFVKAHPFVDGTRLGNMGASYGGFMTMYLATKTDLFRASISHAGISNLTSYWGHGWWGYAYSGVATRGYFPWNQPGFYTEQSPVFHADKVTTPMLLLHGDSDTNVPVGESHQMYTALKLLGKDVELVEFIGDDHHINARTHRLHWWDTILSYFDRELKGQPEWWNHLFPEK